MPEIKDRKKTGKERVEVDQMFAKSDETRQALEKSNENPCHSCSVKKNAQDENITIREEKLKASLVTRLNRVEGQVRGIKGMIERDVYCNDVLNQIAAVQAALDSVSKLVLENHIRGCLVEKIQAGDDKIVDELLVTIGKML
ncbi:metal-sensing transcriptional repressor [Anoxybacterium hadale]|uniref:Metal-sensing transcriptional repressor n=1 Tax=Anoxybacterium hadale TaxID=3408580 RepID=A0ACD1A781_9FIRM|nr:metal-sensing transcriptional repressor [Clostridiales bacterium]